MHDHHTRRSAVGGRFWGYLAAAAVVATIAILALVAADSAPARLLVAMTAPLLSGAALTAYAVAAGGQS